VEIDAINIRQATHAAMRRAVAALAIAPAHVLVDGNDLPAMLHGGKAIAGAETIVRGDASSASIAAASIIAKVTRDRLMRRLCAAHPLYGFSRHMGYPTPGHLEAIARHGPSPYHRLSFAPLWRDRGRHRVKIFRNQRDSLIGRTLASLFWTAMSEKDTCAAPHP